MRLTDVRLPNTCRTLKRKETIKSFANAKERHCLRYTNYRDKAFAAIIFACMNFKIGIEKSQKHLAFNEIFTPANLKAHLKFN